MNYFVTINIIIMILGLGFLLKLKTYNLGFSWRVFCAVVLGAFFGYSLQRYYGQNSSIITSSISYFNVVGKGYVLLLNMIIVPLVMVSIINAINKLKDNKSLGKITGYCLGILLFTVAVAALVGIFTALKFGLSAEGLAQGARELSRGESLTNNLGHLQQTSLPNMLLSLIPANPFLDMTGARSTSIISVVIFSVFIGVASLSIHKTQPQLGGYFDRFIATAHSIVLHMVRTVLSFTPYGIFALVSILVATSKLSDMLNLVSFLAASYTAILIMFVFHLFLVFLAGAKPWPFLKKCFPTLLFAFTSRTSAGTMPLTIQTQVKKLGVPEGIANFAASFGASIGQNGCAGIYPAMLAVMIAPTVGIDPTDFGFIFTLVVTIVVGSFGVAGVGGGATFAALIVLSAMNLPVALVGLLISIEPFIDMGRTALNVNGAITSGFLTSRLMGSTDKNILNSESDDLLSEVKEAP